MTQHKNIDFGVDGRQQISSQLKKFLNISNLKILQDIIDEIELSGAIRAFAFGSLINEPHTEDLTRQYRVDVPMWRREFCVLDCFYRGTPDMPGIALGLVACDKNASTPGAVLETQLDPENISISLVRTLHWIEFFGLRENPKSNSAYCFELVKTIATHGSHTNAIACVADTQSPFYIDPDITLEQRAATIAGSYGPTYRNRASRTSMQYLRDTINDCRKRGLPLESDFMDMLILGNAIRNAMPRDKQRHLERFEMDKGYDDDLYDTYGKTAPCADGDGFEFVLEAWKVFAKNIR